MKYGFTMYEDKIVAGEGEDTSIYYFDSSNEQVKAQELIYSVWWAKQTGHAFFNESGMTFEQALQITAASREVVINERH